MDEEPLATRNMQENQIVNDGAISLSSSGSHLKKPAAEDSAAGPKEPQEAPAKRAQGDNEVRLQSPIDIEISLENELQTDAVLSAEQAGKKELKEKKKPKEGAKKRGRPRLNKKKEPSSGKKGSKRWLTEKSSSRRKGRTRKGRKSRRRSG